jgi:hypothetical protein
LKLLKVQWKDGDVVSERHFRDLERWIEATYAVIATQTPGHGLLRATESDGSFNAPSSVSVRHVQGTQYQILVQNFQGLSGKGGIISVFERRQFDITLRTTERDNDGYYNLFLVPVEDDGGESHAADITGGEPILYEPECRPQTSDELREGICIARFKADGPTIVPDASFVPLSYTLHASPPGQSRHEKIRDGYTRLTHSIEQYVRALSNRKGLEPIWFFSVELFRLLSRHKTTFTEVQQVSYEFFSRSQSLFDAVTGELKILAAEYKEAKLLGEVHGSIERLSRPVLALALEYNMAHAFAAVEDGIDELAHLLSRFPEGPAVEASLAVRELTFSKGTAYNKLTVQFVEQVHYTREASRLLVKLRDYSTREPSTWDVRLALGNDMPYGSLPQLNNVLKRVGKDEFDFRIEFPGDVLGTGTMKMLVLYLPPPMGENVDTHPSRVTLSMVS